MSGVNGNSVVCLVTWPTNESEAGFDLGFDRNFTAFLRADLHGTIFAACDNGLRQPHDMTYDCCVCQKICRSILKQVLKRYDNRKSCLRPVTSLSHATKIAPCKSALRASFNRGS